MAVRFVKAGTAVRVLMDGRWRHCIVVEVTDQDTITVRLGHKEPVGAVRVSRTRFEAVEPE